MTIILKLYNKQGCILNTAKGIQHKTYSICVVKGDNKYQKKLCQRLNGDSYLFMIYREKGMIKYEKHRTYRN